MQYDRRPAEFLGSGPKKSIPSQYACNAYVSKGYDRGARVRRPDDGEAGARVHHPVFGDGTVIDDDPDAGTVTVRFIEFGTRRIAKDSNLLKEGEFSNF